MNDSVTVSQLIDNCILAWEQTPSLVPLSKILEREKMFLEGWLNNFAVQFPHEFSLDMARRLMLQHVLQDFDVGTETRRFIFREPQPLIRVFLEDSIGMEPEMRTNMVILPYQHEAIRIVMRGVLDRTLTDKICDEVVCFFRFMMGDKNIAKIEQDKISTYKTMIWFSYLLIDLIRIDIDICQGGIEHVNARFTHLLDLAINGGIVSEIGLSPSYEGGRWNNTLFAWLQGADRRSLAVRLKRQFNIEKQSEHIHPCLLPEQRRRMFEEAILLICSNKCTAGAI